VPGNTFYRDPVTNFPMVFGGRLTMFVSVDGRLYGTFTRRPAIGPEYDVGRWHITRPRGCFAARGKCGTTDGNAAIPCTSRSRSCTGGETFELYPRDCLGKDVYRRVLGNPEGY